MRFHKRDEYYSSTEDHQFTICRIFIRQQEFFEAWKGKRRLAWVEAGENRREAWKQAIEICEKGSLRI